MISAPYSEILRPTLREIDKSVGTSKDFCKKGLTLFRNCITVQFYMLHFSIKCLNYILKFLSSKKRNKLWPCTSVIPFSLGQWKYKFFTQKDVKIPHLLMAKNFGKTNNDNMLRNVSQLSVLKRFIKDYTEM